MYQDSQTLEVITAVIFSSVQALNTDVQTK